MSRLPIPSPVRPGATYSECTQDSSSRRRPRTSEPSSASQTSLSALSIRERIHRSTSPGGCSSGGIRGTAASRARRSSPVRASASRGPASRTVSSPSDGIPQLVQGLLEVVGVVRLVLDVLAALRMLEAQAYGVQPLPCQPDARSERGVGAVGQVADAGMLEGGHVHADLVGAAGLEVHLEEA